MVGTWICADCPLFMPWQIAQKPPSPSSHWCSREPWPPVRVDMRWNHWPSFFYVFLIDCVYWDVFLRGFGSFYPGSRALSSILHIKQLWIYVAALLTSDRTHTHSHRKNIVQKATYIPFYFLPSHLI